MREGGEMITETRAKLEMLMDMWNDLRELENKVSELYVYIYHKELERQRKKDPTGVWEYKGNGEWEEIDKEVSE